MSLKNFKQNRKYQVLFTLYSCTFLTTWFSHEQRHTEFERFAHSSYRVASVWSRKREVEHASHFQILWDFVSCFVTLDQKLKWEVERLVSARVWLSSPSVTDNCTQIIISVNSYTCTFMWVWASLLREHDADEVNEMTGFVPLLSSGVMEGRSRGSISPGRSNDRKHGETPGERQVKNKSIFVDSLCLSWNSIKVAVSLPLCPPVSAYHFILAKN